MHKIVAVARSDSDLYARRSAHAVSIMSAGKICNALNRSRFRLRSGETWRVFTVGMQAYKSCPAAFHRFLLRSGRLYEMR